MSPWPPGSERKRLSDIPPGTEVLIGATVLTLDRWELSPGGTMYLLYWRERKEPGKYQEEPTLTVWPAKQPDAT